MKYRAEIDGLRALAVVPVILFHAGFDLFRGGFVGVDIFFVISGYLITTILVEDIQNERFSIINFYDRRARRILPALFFVLIVCIPIAIVWLLPRDLSMFGQSLFAVSVFASNLYFDWIIGYFAPTADLHPLLHTWSLAVEEQFYLIFPIVLLITWRFGRSRVFWLLAAIAGASLLYSEMIWRQGDSPSFFLAPTRAWELLAGSIAALIIQKRGIQSNNGLALLGLGAILFSIFFYTEHTPFPSAYGLVPVLGVVLIVLFADGQTLVSRLLSNKLFVGIGLISYSAYLWHQPLFAFTRVRLLNEPSAAIMLVLCIVSIALGWLSWRYVERPFRDRTQVSRAKLIIVSVAALGCFGLTYGAIRSDSIPHSAYVKTLSGFSDANDAVRRAACAPLSGDHPAEHCTLGNANNIKGALIGDSHAHMLWSPLNEHLNQLNMGVRSYVQPGCMPVRNTHSPTRWGNYCFDQTTKSLDEVVSSDDFDFVILAARWSIYTEQTRFNNGEGGVEGGENVIFDIVENGKKLNNKQTIRQEKMLAQVQKTIQELIDSGKTVFVLYPVPEVGFHVPERLAKIEMYDIENYSITHSYERYQSRNEKIRTLFDDMQSSASENLIFIDVSEQLCSESTGRCTVVGENSYPLYNDDDHLSNFGSNLVVEPIRAKVQKMYPTTRKVALNALGNGSKSVTGAEKKWWLHLDLN